MSKTAETCPIVARLLTTPPGRKSRVIQRHLVILGYIAQGVMTPLGLAAAAGITPAQVWTSITWLDRENYISRTVQGQIYQVTLTGRDRLARELGRVSL